MAKAQKPNVLIFNPDSYRGDVLGHMGNTGAATPNFDALTRDGGLSFRCAYSQNTVCVPSRCSYLTGWYPHVRGHRTMSHMLHAELGETSLLRVLKQHGYTVWWGESYDITPGQFGVAGALEHCTTYYRPSPQDLKRWGVSTFTDTVPQSEWRGTDARDDRFYGFLRGVTHDDDGLSIGSDAGKVRGAMEFIEQHDSDVPFCLYVPVGGAHPPYMIDRHFYDTIDPDSLPDRILPPAEPAAEPSMRTQIRSKNGLASWPEDRWRELRRVYYAQCARTDALFGLLIRALKKAGLYDSTLIIVLSDHGDFTGDYGLVEKTQNTFEECLTRVPFIIKPPNATAGVEGVSDALVELVDMSATVYDVCDVEPGYTHFGRSLVPLLRGRTAKHRDAVFCEGGRLHGESHCTEPVPSEKYPYWPKTSTQLSEGPEHTKAVMCRTHDFKYVKRLYESDQLFDLRADPQERHDLVDHPAHRETLTQMRNRMLDWYVQTCDVVPHQQDWRKFG
ncbi:MAG: sulfatase-like hydrolase/transferase [Chitinivibrionales bacterium]|nr:sulfatase-like hydrolase/transferase [Chitinivibrionales bacterium]